MIKENRMKQKKLTNKLILNKKSIANLDVISLEESKNVKGGTNTTTTSTVTNMLSCWDLSCL